MKKTYLIPVAVILILIVILISRKFGKENTENRVQDETEIQATADTLKISEPEAVIAEGNQVGENETDKLEKKKPNVAVKAPDPKLKLRSIEALNSYLASLKEQPQIFTISGSDTSSVIGDQGSIIYVTPNAFETIEGNPIGDSIRVELLEVFTQSEMIKNGVRTMSGDSILISDGMFKIEMFSGGKALRIRRGSVLNVAIPKLTDEDMSIFIGRPDSTGSPNWELAGGVPMYSYSVIAEPLDDDNNLIYYSRDLSNEERSALIQKSIATDNTFRNFGISSFGWWNLDKYLKRNSSRSTLTLEYDKDSIEVFEFYLIFKDLNIISSQRFMHFPVNYRFGRMPGRQNLTLLAIGFYDTIPFISEQDIYINQELTYKPEFTRTTKTDITKRIEALNSIRRSNR